MNDQLYSKTDKKMNAFRKDIFRTIIKERKRLMALAVIAALGVTMMTGLKASCDDLRISAHTFFNGQRLHDLSVVSTLGLTDNDITALKSIDGIADAQGQFSQKVRFQKPEGQLSAIIKTVDPAGIDQPYVIQGRLPDKADEIALSQSCLAAMDKSVGDTITITEQSDGKTVVSVDLDAIDDSDSLQEPEEALFKQQTFTITGSVIDVTMIINPDGPTAYRNGGAETNIGFVLPTAVTADYYTAVNLIISDAEKLDPFSETYRTRVSDIKKAIESMVKEKQETARYNTLKNEIDEKLADAEKIMNDSFADAEAKLSASRQELDNSWAQIREAQNQLDIESAKAITEINEARKNLDEQISLLNDPAIQQTQMIETDDQSREALQSIQKAYATLDAEEANAAAQFSAAQAEIDAGIQKLNDGEVQYTEGVEAFQREKEKALSDLSKARSEAESQIGICQWYLQDRNSLNGFDAMTSDADCIESIGTIFPIMFLLVALLISLTTITRMVDENRGNIGTYMGLGYTKKEIRKKYFIYAVIAAFVGGVIGNGLGYIALPEFLFLIFKVMYLLPHYQLAYNALYGIGGILLFIVAIGGAAIWSCKNTLNNKAAELMRPKPPANGSRILLERFKKLWSRLSFFQRVTARNLFRYKKRMLMTIFGIAGCTALLITGLSIKDTVAALRPRQYGNVIRYDIMTVTAGDEDNDAIIRLLQSQSEKIDTSLNLMIDTVEVRQPEGRSMNVQLYVIPDKTDCSPYIHLMDLNDQPLTLSDDGFYVTRNIGSILDISTKDQIMLRDSAFKEASGSVNSVLQNYLGNMVIMTQQCYKNHFGDYKPNAFLINLKNKNDSIALENLLKDKDEIMSISSIQNLEDNFAQSFAMMDMVFYVVIVLAAALAFSVLFTLATTNISERERELATIMVLGFNRLEVHHYINKESVILTCIGIVAGMPLGIFISHFIEMALKLPSIVYDVVIRPVSYFYAAGIALIFSLIVNWMTGKVMDRIKPVSALKGVE